MLPGHKNKCRCCNSFTRFIFNLQKRKINTVLCNNMQHTVCTCRVLKCKNPWLGVVAISARFKPHPTLDTCLKIDWPVSHKLLAPPLPQAHPFQPHIPTHVSQFHTSRRRHRHIRRPLHPIQLPIELVFSTAVNTKLVCQEITVKFKSWILIETC
jgi:hypothetical protein